MGGSGMKQSGSDGTGMKELGVGRSEKGGGEKMIEMKVEVRMAVTWKTLHDY